MSKLYYSGTSGLVLPFNKSQFPEDFKTHTRLEYYASLNNSIEINSTFYKSPLKSTIAKWSDGVPQDFKFTFKLPKTLTHEKAEKFDVARFLEFMNIISFDTLHHGCILAQFPPSFSIKNIPYLLEFLEAFKTSIQCSKWNLAIEFRNCTWYNNETAEMLYRYKASMVLHDMKNSETGWSADACDFVYLRFHGTLPRYRGNYSTSFLENRARQIHQWLLEGRTVYVYFNNTLGEAYGNLQSLNTLVNS